MVDRKGIVSCAVGVALAMVAAPVRAQPANDDCAAATVVTSLPFTETVDTSLATTEVGEPTPSCLFSGSGQTIWYAWTNGSSEDVRLSIDVFDPEDPLTDPFAAAIAFDALGVGRLANRSVALVRGDARATVTISAYGRVRRR